MELTKEELKRCYQWFNYIITKQGQDILTAKDHLLWRKLYDLIELSKEDIITKKVELYIKAIKYLEANNLTKDQAIQLIIHMKA